MAYKVAFEAADLQWQIELLKLEPQIANNRLMPAMKQSTKEARSEIEPTIPIAGGAAKAAFQDRVSGKGLNITGRVGWWGPSAGPVYYINIVEYGARAHGMGYIPALQVRINEHPGIAPHKFMEQGFQKTEAQVNENMAKAADEIMNDLAVK